MKKFKKFKEQYHYRDSSAACCATCKYSKIGRRIAGLYCFLNDDGSFQTIDSMVCDAYLPKDQTV